MPCPLCGGVVFSTLGYVDGVVGNSGHTAQAALPGAVAGLALYRALLRAAQRAILG